MNTTIPTVIFWAGLFLVVYAYLGYGLVLYLLVQVKRVFARPVIPVPDYCPDVTFIVCAFNEEECMAQKITNSLALDYPPERIRFFFVTDGSNDRTADIVRNYSFPESVNREWFHEPERRGKIGAFQRVMPFVQSPVVISTDANTLVNREAVRNIVRHFSDPAIGAVAGEKRILSGKKAGAGSAGEGIYWKYESMLKKWDAELWSVIGAAGELFAFRTDLYEHVPPDTLVEDFYLTMRIARKGYRVQYEPDACAVETSSASVAEEMKRKVRIAAGGLQAVVRLAPLLNIFRYGVLSFQYVSHRVLRWTLAPLFLPVLLIVNVILAGQGAFFYRVFLAGQLLFYAAALAGYLLERKELKVKAFFVPYYFCLMNYAMYAGFFRLVRGRQSVLWERAKRA
ncbi:MAG: glycosyltransferase family 2 protein [Lewinellaceae bacterium]|nr:glycosyltransferase family 2 protein [Lewinellaceae bacterium]